MRSPLANRLRSLQLPSGSSPPSEPCRPFVRWSPLGVSPESSEEVPSRTPRGLCSAGVRARHLRKGLGSIPSWAWPPPWFRLSDLATCPHAASAHDLVSEACNVTSTTGLQRLPVRPPDARLSPLIDHPGVSGRPLPPGSHRHGLGGGRQLTLSRSSWLPGPISPTPFECRFPRPSLPTGSSPPAERLQAFTWRLPLGVGLVSLSAPCGVVSGRCVTLRVSSQPESVPAPSEEVLGRYPPGLVSTFADTA